MSVRRILGVSLLLMLSQSINGERLPIKTYTAADGLAHNNVNRVVRDSRGFLWFCTEEGLSRFDGYTFTNYGVEQGLPHRIVTDFLETRTGQFWLSTYGGLVRFNPKGTPLGRVVYASEPPATPAPMFTLVVPEDEDRYARAATVLVEGRDGTIWCGTMKHLYRLEEHGGRFELLPVDIGIPTDQSRVVHAVDLLEDRRGSLWVASFVGLFQRRPDGSTRQYTRRDGLPDENIHDLLEDSQGRLWAGTRLAGFFRFDPDDSNATPFVVESYSRRNGLPTDWVFQLYQTSDHRFWVATNLGLVEFFPGADAQNPRFRTYTRRNGLSFQEITALNEDTGGNLWLGTNTAGAMKLARNGFVTYGEQDGLVSVYAIFEDAAGGVCFRGAVLGDQRASAFDGARQDLPPPGADNFFSRFGRFDGRRFDWFKPRIPFDFGWVPDQAAVQTRDGEWWVGSGAGLYRFPASENFARIKTARPLAAYTARDGLPAQQVGQVLADSGGNIWVSGSGLARWDRASRTFSNLADARGLPSPKENPALSLGEDLAGNVWISFNPGVARYREGRFTFFGAGEGLPLGPITNIYPDRAGRLWLASSRGGLIRVDDATGERPVFTSYTTAQGLSSNSVEVITEDLYGRIYVATGLGLDQLDSKTGRIKHFTADDGLAPGNIVAAYRDRTGALWFGTHRGLSRLRPAPAEAGAPPPILISGVRITGEQQTLSALGEIESALPDLAPGRNQLQIDFVALGFTSGDILRYQYRLEGASEDWGPLTEQRTVNFANLAAGRYRFLVRAVNADGVASEVPASLSFRILPPIWQRWWVVTIAALMASVLVYALYRYRMARLLEIERVRTRIASDLHDDIGANLTRIAILSEVAHAQLHGDTGSIETPLSSIADISRESVASMGDIVWAINPKRDHLIDLVQRMRRVAGEVFAGRKIDFEFRAPESEEGLKLGSDVRRDVFLIFKESVTNAARHSTCSRVDIELRVERSSLLLTVRDDGRGFDTEALTEGNGLVSMRRRAASLGGEFRLKSVEGSGAEVILRVPIR